MLIEWLALAVVQLAVLLLIHRAMRRGEAPEPGARDEPLSGPPPISAGPVVLMSPERSRGAA